MIDKMMKAITDFPSAKSIRLATLLNQRNVISGMIQKAKNDGIFTTSGNFVIHPIIVAALQKAGYVMGDYQPPSLGLVLIGKQSNVGFTISWTEDLIPENINLEDKDPECNDPNDLELIDGQ